MIVLDTNVVSELARSVPDPRVIRWLDQQAPESVWSTSVNLFESFYGIEKLPAGRRRDDLDANLRMIYGTDLSGRVLSFDTAAAQAAAALLNRCERLGRRIDVADAQIAGIVHARRGTLATRNVKHFADTGIKLANPWEESQPRVV